MLLSVKSLPKPHFSVEANKAKLGTGIAHKWIHKMRTCNDVSKYVK